MEGFTIRETKENKTIEMDSIQRRVRLRSVYDLQCDGQPKRNWKEQVGIHQE
jgi:hypothetical protein